MGKTKDLAYANATLTKLVRLLAYATARYGEDGMILRIPREILSGKPTINLGLEETEDQIVLALDRRWNL